MSVNEDTDLESLEPEGLVKAAEGIIKRIKENPTPEEIELLQNFVREDIKHRKEESTTSGSEVPSLENQQWIGEKLLVFKTNDIGKGSNGTIVYEGSYEKRPVAVKCLLQSHCKLANNEIDKLIELDHHQNIVRYYGEEQTRDFIYLALERCLCNLDDLIQIYSPVGCSKTTFKEDRLAALKGILGKFNLHNEIKDRSSPLLLKLMRDVSSGLVYLHDYPRIVHRNIKPQNILITKSGPTLCAKLSDMGICKKLSDDKSSLSNHSTGCASTGWKAPEQLLNQRQTRALDLFSFGCVLFFCITNGKHPFGDPDDRDWNIKRNNKQNMDIIEKFPEAFHLISALLEADPKKRPKAIEVRNHPLFWDAKRRLWFLHDTSDDVNKNSVLFKALKRTARSVLGTKPNGKAIQAWNENMDDKIISHSRQYITKDYKFYSVRDLLRLIRNLFNHHKQLPDEIKKLVGDSKEEFDAYFTSRFPKLLIEVYKVVCEYGEEDFEEDDNFWK